MPQNRPFLSLFFSFFLCISISFFGDEIFEDQNHNVVRISVVKSAHEIDLNKSQEILVKSFMTAYEDVPLIELNPEFKSTGDVRRFYEHYFFEEFEHFKQGKLFWIQAFLNEELVGWATFELEPTETNAAYMNLLAVDPKYQRMGIGKHLTFSIRSDELFPQIQAINLLIRKVNTEGYKFYYRLGFVDYDYHRDNFVDTSLLTGLRWDLYTE
jgi:ribosomal protein S18 acetylase RimI-like enzyme